MVTREQIADIKQKAFELYEKAHVVLTEEEKQNLEITDFGLSDIYKTGLASITHVNTDRCCAKVIAVLPHQTFPEHSHPPFDGPGKEETIRCRYGKLYLYISGEVTPDRQCQPPEGIYTVWREVILNPGQQYTLFPGTLHWYQAGDEGAVVSEFSTKSYDEFAAFTDFNVRRTIHIAD